MKVGTGEKVEGEKGERTRERLKASPQRRRQPMVILELLGREISTIMHRQLP